MWGQKYQPNRLDTYLIAATAAIHNSADSTLNQQYWGHTYKAEWDSVISDKMFFEVRGGQFGYDWPYTRNSNAPAFQDLSTNVVSGGNQDGWWTNRRRNQGFATLSIFKDGWAGSHNFKIGGELFGESTEYKRGFGGVGNVPGDVLHILRNGVPSEVLLFQSPVDSFDGLSTLGLYVTDTWRASSKLTLSLGLRFDRYRSYLPAQVGPPTSTFNPNPQVTFAAIDNLLTWNLPAPRLGFTYDLTGSGKTVIKGNFAQYWWNPGTAVIAENVNNNPVDWYNRYNWTDKNGNGVWDQGEQGALTASRGGVGSAILDPAGSAGHLHARSRRLGGARAGAERRRARGFRVAPHLAARAVEQRQPSALGLQRADDDSRSGSRRRAEDGGRWRVDPGLQPERGGAGLAGAERAAEHART